MKLLLEIRPYFWSDRLDMWVQFVEQRDAEAPKGKVQVTMADVARVKELLDQGWGRSEIIQRLFGITA